MYDIRLMYEVGKLRMQEFREEGNKQHTPEPGILVGRVTPNSASTCCTPTALTARP